VNDGAVLDLNGFDIGNKSLSIIGAGISGGGALINNSATDAIVGMGDLSSSTATAVSAELEI